MKKAIITTWLIWPLLYLAAGAQTLTLEQCVSSAMANHPTSRKVPLIMQVEQVNRQLINQSSLPVVILNAQATWQSDVVNFTLDLPFPVTFPVIPKDQYKVTVDVQQMLYDGGVRQIRQSLNTLETTIKKDELEVVHQKLRSSVEQIFFSILVVEKKKATAELMLRTLDATIARTKAAVQHGIVKSEELEVLGAEQTRMEQQILEIQYTRRRLLAGLSVLMGQTFSSNVKLVTPLIPTSVVDGQRPEIRLFALQMNHLSWQQKLLQTQRIPKLIGFGQAGYGKPGLNFLGDSWEPYTLVGVKASWNIWDWNKTRREKQLLNITRKSISIDQEQFEQQLAIQIDQTRITIEKYRRLIEKGKELVAHRQHISEVYKSRLENGMIPASLFLAEWNNQQDALNRLEQYKIQQLAAEYQLLTLQSKHESHE